MEKHHRIPQKLIHPLAMNKTNQWSRMRLGKPVMWSIGKIIISMFGLCVARARLRQLPGKRVRNLHKIQHQRAKKGMTVKKCVSKINIITCEHNILFNHAVARMNRLHPPTLVVAASQPRKPHPPTHPLLVKVVVSLKLLNHLLTMPNQWSIDL